MPPPKRRAPGRPAGGSDEIVTSVLAVAFRHLIERGYAEMRIDDVARDAAVNKTSIYRRWPKKSDLVLAALLAAREPEAPFRESGELRADLISLLSRKAARLATPSGRAIGRALMSIGVDAEDDLAARIRTSRYQLSTSVLERAVARGDVGPGVDITFVSELLVAPILHRSLISGEPADLAFIERVVDHILRGLPPGRR